MLNLQSLNVLIEDASLNLIHHSLHSVVQLLGKAIEHSVHAVVAGHVVDETIHVIERIEGEGLHSGCSQSVVGINSVLGALGVGPGSLHSICVEAEAGQHLIDVGSHTLEVCIQALVLNFLHNLLNIGSVVANLLYCVDVGSSECGGSLIEAVASSTCPTEGEGLVALLEGAQRNLGSLSLAVLQCEHLTGEVHGVGVDGHIECTGIAFAVVQQDITCMIEHFVREAEELHFLSGESLGGTYVATSAACGEVDVVVSLAIVCHQHLGVHVERQAERTKCGVVSTLDGDAGDHVGKIFLQVLYAILQTLQCSDSLFSVGHAILQTRYVALQLLNVSLHELVGSLVSLFYLVDASGVGLDERANAVDGSGEGLLRYVGVLDSFHAILDLDNLFEDGVNLLLCGSVNFLQTLRNGSEAVDAGIELIVGFLHVVLDVGSHIAERIYFLLQVGNVLSVGSDSGLQDGNLLISVCLGLLQVGIGQSLDASQLLSHVLYGLVEAVGQSGQVGLQLRHVARQLVHQILQVGDVLLSSAHARSELVDQLLVGSGLCLSLGSVLVSHLQRVAHGHQLELNVVDSLLVEVGQSLGGVSGRLGSVGSCLGSFSSSLGSLGSRLSGSSISGSLIGSGLGSVSSGLGSIGGSLGSVSTGSSVLGQSLCVGSSGLHSTQTGKDGREVATTLASALALGSLNGSLQSLDGLCVLALGHIGRSDKRTQRIDFILQLLYGSQSLEVSEVGLLCQCGLQCSKLCLYGIHVTLTRVDGFQLLLIERQLGLQVVNLCLQRLREIRLIADHNQTQLVNLVLQILVSILT